MLVLSDLPGLWGHLWRGTRYSLQGLWAACRHEQAFRLELIVASIAVPVGLWLGQTGSQRALLIGSWALVLIVELLNSAVEAAVDRMGSELHELAGRAKDLGSAAVFLAIALAVVVWGVVVFGS
jgi:diacylglycerol kinase (ATP)